MLSVYQVSDEKQVKDSDVARKGVKNEVARKRRVQEVATNKEMIGTDEDSDSRNGSSVSQVLKMIQEGSYSPKFHDYLNEQSLVGPGQKPRRSHEGCGCNFFCKKLFQKELTPSDVSSLNRLVIPKKFAVMHLHGNVHHQPTDSEIVCYDRLNAEWKFRFCYWKSSQSFVLTRGWNAFVKANNLKAKDTLLFSTCQCPSDKITTTSTATTAYGIDVQHYNDQQMDSNARKQGGFRLFGVQINI